MALLGLRKRVLLDGANHVVDGQADDNATKLYTDTGIGSGIDRDSDAILGESRNSGNRLA